MSITFTEDELAMARALRDATALEREPTPGCPDGIHRMHAITELLAERWLPAGDPVGWQRVARRLARRGLAAHRRTLGVSRFGLAPAGASQLRAAEQRRGRTVEVIARQALAQAEHDLETARREVRVRTEARDRARRELEHLSGTFSVALERV